MLFTKKTSVVKKVKAAGPLFFTMTCKKIIEVKNNELSTLARCFL